jgi:hypothetical protein
VRGVDLVTGGVGVCPSFAGQNLERLSDAVTELGPCRNGAVVTERALDANPVLRINTAVGRLSIVASPAGIPNGYIDLRRAASREDLGDGLWPLVAGTRDLAAMAAALHRRIDTERLPALRRIFELEVDLEPAPEATPSPRRIAPRRTLRTSRRIGL